MVGSILVLVVILWFATGTLACACMQAQESSQIVLLVALFILDLILTILYREVKNINNHVLTYFLNVDRTSQGKYF